MHISSKSIEGYFDKTKDFDNICFVLFVLFFLMKDNELFKKYDEIWKTNSIKKGFDSQPTYNKKNLKN